VDHRRRYCWCNRISCLQLITDRSPKDRYQTKVESWRDLQSESSLRWNGLREPIGRSAPVLCSRFGRPRIKYEHNYPAYFPQAISNPQHLCSTLTMRLAEFREWARDLSRKTDSGLSAG
jgi:hypothetical protein